MTDKAKRKNACSICDKSVTDGRDMVEGTKRTRVALLSGATSDYTVCRDCTMDARSMIMAHRRALLAFKAFLRREDIQRRDERQMAALVKSIRQFANDLPIGILGSTDARIGRLRVR